MFMLSNYNHSKGSTRCKWFGTATLCDGACSDGDGTLPIECARCKTKACAAKTHFGASGFGGGCHFGLKLLCCSCEKGHFDAIKRICVPSLRKHQ